METLIDLLYLFKKRDKKEAFIYRTGIRRFTFSYGEIYTLSLKMSTFLEKSGIKKGDKVAIWAPNSPFWAVSFFGILLKGAIVVPIDFASGKQRVLDIINHSGAKFIIQSHYKFEKISQIKSAAIEDLIFYLKNVPAMNQFPRLTKKDICTIVYTSGTTGNPKGVVLTHKNLVANIKQASEHIHFPQSFTFLSVLPLSHLFEQTGGFLTALFRGDKIVYIRTIKPSSIMETLLKEKISGMLVVPRILQLLKSSIEREFDSMGLGVFLKNDIFKKIVSPFIHKKFGSNFQMFISGGAALQVDIFNFWNSLGFKVVEGFGLTECSPILTANTFEEQTAGSVGKAVKGVKIKLINNELLVKGDNVFSSYYKNPKETNNSFYKGWFRTGDLATQDRQGNIYIKGRKKDLIVKSSGVNINPQEIEDVLNKINGVKDSCVLGIDKGGGEETHAVILLKDKNYNKDEILRKANEKLDPLSQIESISIWKDFDFPRTTTLKIQKFKVRESLTSNKFISERSKDTLISLLSGISKKPVESIQEDSYLTSDLGMDSLSRLELINFLEQEYRLDLDDSFINQNTKVSDIRILIQKREGKYKKSGLWLWTNGYFGRKIRVVLDNLIHIPVSKIIFDLDIKGVSNLKTIKPPVIFISNHVSYLDQPAIMFSLPPSWRYNTATAIREEFFFNTRKKDLYHRLFFPYTIVAFNGFLLPQKSGFRRSLSFMGKLIDSKVNILIFPEGTRSRTGHIASFMQGLGLMAKELQVPIVPIRIFGMEKIFPKGAILPKRGKCVVRFGKPMKFTIEPLSEIVSKSRQAVLALKN